MKIMFTPSDDPLVDADTPNPARIYDYLLGGANNFAADRDAAEQAMRVGQVGRTVARSNRAFLRRAVRFMCEQGVDQFLDLGSGIPTVGNVHEIAQQANPHARVAYVDNETVAVTYARRLLADDPRSVMVEADLRHPEQVLADPALTGLLDLSRPVGILLVSVLHFVPDAEDPAGIVAGYREAAAGGGYLVVSHYTDEGYSEEKRARAEAGKDVYQRRTRTPVVARGRAELAALLAGTELVPPGVVWAPDWHPDGTGTDPEVSSESEMYAAVARIP
jgi:hypothetical protein